MAVQTKKTVVSNVRAKSKRPALYHVLMLNDDFTPMDFVIKLLVDIFDKDETEAVALMLKVHHGDRAVVGTYSYDIAVTKKNQAITRARKQGYPFQVVVEKAE